jgi:serine/threonine protein kinase
MGLDVTSVGSYVGGYKLLKYLGEGRLGMYFRARHQDEEKAHRQGGDVALRAFRTELCDREDFRERFTASLRPIRQLEHPSVTRNVDALQLPDGQICTVDEFIEGSPVSSLLGREVSLPWSRALAIFHPVLAALAHAHARNVLHGGVRPGNVIIRSDDTIALMDFGIAAQELGPGLEFMAPELMREGAGALLVGARPAHPPTEKSDVYSVGMCLYYALAGTYPWGTGKEPREIIEAKRAARTPRVDTLNPSVPAPLGQVLQGAIATDPAERIPTVTDLARALTRASEPAIGNWVRPGRTITREKQYVAQKLEQALHRRERQGQSTAKLKSVDLRAASSRALEAIRTGEVDAQEVARINKAREAWARRFERRSARNWAYATSAVSGPLAVGICGLLILMGAPLPIPEDWMVFVLPSLVFFYLGAMLALVAGKRKRTSQDLSVLVAGLISPLVSVAVLFGGDWVLTTTKLGGEPGSGPRAAALLSLIWTANALLGCWYGERQNVEAEKQRIRSALPKEARRDSGPITTRGFKAISEAALTSGRIKIPGSKRRVKTVTDRHKTVSPDAARAEITDRHKAVE